MVSSRNSALFVHLLERVDFLLWRLLTLGISTDDEAVGLGQSRWVGGEVRL